MQLIPNVAGLPADQVKVGLLAGSFNPPHAGHIDLAIQAKKAGLDRILFYANSFNLAKSMDLAPIDCRRAMLARMIDPACMSILPGQFYPDAPESALIGGEYSFSPLLRLLHDTFPSNHEIWMLRGADYFTRSDGQYALYPHELRHQPHLVGTRGLDPAELNLEILDKYICVETMIQSSTALRKQAAKNGIHGRLEEAWRPVHSQSKRKDNIQEEGWRE